MANSVGLHEAEDRLDRATMDRHRALSSLQEELEAIDWYDQRIDAAEDVELKQILAHNRDEEKEHAAMVLEWLRRRDSAIESALRLYLFSEGSIVDREREVEAAEASTGDGSLGIGSLRNDR
ncbi:MAG: encapsulin-associated ferritin-like protein [Candidatus Binatia bacterium]